MENIFLIGSINVFKINMQCFSLINSFRCRCGILAVSNSQIITFHLLAKSFGIFYIFCFFFFFFFFFFWSSADEVFDDQANKISPVSGIESPTESPNSVEKKQDDSHISTHTTMTIGQRYSAKQQRKADFAESHEVCQSTSHGRQEGSQAARSSAENLGQIETFDADRASRVKPEEAKTFSKEIGGVNDGNVDDGSSKVNQDQSRQKVEDASRLQTQVPADPGMYIHEMEFEREQGRHGGDVPENNQTPTSSVDCPKAHCACTRCQYSNNSTPQVTQRSPNTATTMPQRSQSLENVTVSSDTETRVCPETLPRVHFDFCNPRLGNDEPSRLARLDEDVCKSDLNGTRKGQGHQCNKSRCDTCAENFRDHRPTNTNSRKEVDVPQHVCHSPNKKARIDSYVERSTLEISTARSNIDNSTHISRQEKYTDGDRMDGYVDRSIRKSSMVLSKEDYCVERDSQRNVHTVGLESHSISLSSDSHHGSPYGQLSFDGIRSAPVSLSRNDPAVSNTESNASHLSLSDGHQKHFHFYRPLYAECPRPSQHQTANPSSQNADFKSSFSPPIFASVLKEHLPRNEPEPETVSPFTSFPQPPITLGNGAFRAPSLRREQVQQQSAHPDEPPIPVNFLRSHFLHTLHHHHPHHQQQQNQPRSCAVLPPSGPSNSLCGDSATNQKFPSLRYSRNLASGDFGSCLTSPRLAMPGETSDHQGHNLSGRYDDTRTLPQSQHAFALPSPASSSNIREEMLHCGNDSGDDSGSDDYGNISSSTGDAPSTSPSINNNKGASDDTSDNSSTKDGRSRRRRTAFTSEQLLELEKEFHSKKYLSLTERSGIAAHLRLSEVQVRRLSPPQDSQGCLKR